MDGRWQMVGRYDHPFDRIYQNFKEIFKVLKQQIDTVVLQFWHPKSGYLNFCFFK